MMRYVDSAKCGFARLVILTVFLANWQASRAAAGQPEGAAPDPRARLFAIWKSQTTDIVSGKFKTTVFRWVDDKPAVNRGQLLGALKSTDWDKGPEALGRLRAFCHPTVP